MKSKLRALSSFGIGVVLPALMCAQDVYAQDLHAQGVGPNDLVHQPADSWLTFHGGYSGERHTNLTEITPENVGKLQQVWRFQTGQQQQIKSSPIVAGGVILQQPLRTTSGRLMPAPPRNSGTTRILPITLSTSATVARPFIRTQFT